MKGFFSFFSKGYEALRLENEALKREIHALKNEGREAFLNNYAPSDNELLVRRVAVQKAVVKALREENAALSADLTRARFELSATKQENTALKDKIAQVLIMVRGEQGREFYSEIHGKFTESADFKGGTDSEKAVKTTQKGGGLKYKRAKKPRQAVNLGTNDATKLKGFEFHAKAKGGAR